MSMDLKMECRKVSEAVQFNQVSEFAAKFKPITFIADGVNAKPAGNVQGTDGVSNLAQQSNAQPKQADNDDISSFTDEQEEKAQSNTVVGATNSIP